MSKFWAPLAHFFSRTLLPDVFLVLCLVIKGKRFVAALSASVGDRKRSNTCALSMRRFNLFC